MRKKLFGFMQGRFGILWCIAVLLSAMFPAKALLAGQEGVDKCRLGEADRTQRKSIADILTNKTASEKSKIKSAEISKYDFRDVYDNTQYGVKVEIVGNPTPITINGQHGIELFAKAWKGNQQLGFGTDGSVEIERFRIFNPPILVDAPNGDIIREWTDIDGVFHQRKLREDPLQAIKESLSHIIKLVGKDNNQIITGKVGNTTDTFYSAAGGNSPVDGYVWRDITSEPLSTIRAGAGNYANYTDNFTVGIRAYQSSPNEWDYLRRSLVFFDTSAIGTDNIDSATLSIYGNIKSQATGGSNELHIASGNAASNSVLVDSDYAQSNFGTTSFSSQSFSSHSTTAYNDFSLNASGIANISKTGISKFSMQVGYDINNNFDGTWVANQGVDYTMYSADQTGTSQDPKLVVVHSAAATPTPTPIPSDTTAPSGSISINSGASYTNSTAVTLNFSATDAVGVLGYYTSTSSSTPTASASGWNSVTSATSYSGSASYTLTSGDETKTVYAWYKDAAGNVSSSSSDSIILDTTAPIVTITSPTSGDTYTTTSSPLSLSGSASDSTSGVSAVTWSNNKGGSGDASGTTYWSVSSVSLSSGDNVITVTAKDNAGNTSTDTITVTYNAGSAPTVKTGSATNVTSTSATLTGTVNANGQSTTAWFEYGTVKGTYGNKSSTQSVSGSTDTTVSITITGLTAGTTYYYRITAQNNSGTSYGEEMSFYKSSVENPPTVETEAATDITNTTAKLNGKCNSNGQSTTAWFEYGTLSGTYNYQTSTQSVSGSSYTNVSATITGLTVGTKYYYRIAAQNSAGTSYGKEMSFYKSTDTQTTPTPTAHQYLHHRLCQRYHLCQHRRLFRHRKYHPVRHRRVLSLDL